MTNWIQNVSIKEIEEGRHFDCGDRAILIQICDPCYVFPKPKHKFDLVYQFDFLDEEDESGSMGEFCIHDDQAEAIIKILQRALDERRNVIVHCHAGMCRSGAVTEVGILMGFTDTGKFRLPNRLVKHKLMKVLGWTYDANADFQPLETTDSGIIIASMANLENGS